MNARAAALLIGFLIPGALGAQTGSIRGVIVARATGEPLAYGIVGIDDVHNAFTNDSGQFTFRDLRPGRHALVVRRLGYAPKDMTFEIRPGIPDSLRVEMDRVTVTLGRVDVKAWPPCISPGHPTDSALSLIVAQIRLNAEQHRFVSSEYPFRYDVKIRLSERLRSDGMVLPARDTIEHVDSRVFRGYKPGDVIFSRGDALMVGVPTLTDVAEKRFVDNHCWHFGGVEHIANEEVYRVDVVAFDSLKGPDVNGSFFVNTRTFHIRRSNLFLSRRSNLLRRTLSFETTTDFSEVVPSITIPWFVRVKQTMDPSRTSLLSESSEEQQTVNFRFIGRSPGAPRP